MKKLYIISIAVLFFNCSTTSIINTSGKCNYSVNKIDAFTKVDVKQTIYQNITNLKFGGNYQLKASGIKSGSKQYLSISLISQNNAFNLYKGNTLQLLNEQNEILTLTIPETKTSELFINSSFYCVQNYLLSAEDLKNLATKNYIKARYQINENQFLDFDIPEANQNTFKDVVKCIIE